MFLVIGRDLAGPGQLARACPRDRVIARARSWPLAEIARSRAASRALAYTHHARCNFNRLCNRASGRAQATRVRHWRTCKWQGRRYRNPVPRVAFPPTIVPVKSENNNDLPSRWSLYSMMKKSYFKDYILALLMEWSWKLGKIWCWAPSLSFGDLVPRN